MNFRKLLIIVLTLIPSLMYAQTEEEYIDKGLDLENEGFYLTAIKYYDSAIMLNEYNAIAYYNRGACYLAEKRYGAALVDYNKALLIDSNIADAYYNRAFVHNKMDNDVLAMDDIEQYTKLQPTDTLGYLLLSEILFKQGEYSRVIAANQRALNYGLERKAVVFRNQGVCYYKLETNSMAEYLLTQALVYDPSYTEVYLRRAEVRLDMEQYKDALEDLHFYLLEEPTNITVLSISSICNFNIERYEAALSDYNKLIELEPNNGDWFFEKGNCLLKLKRDEEAEEAYSEAIKNSKNIGWILVMRGISRHNQKKSEEACFDWNQGRLLGEEEAINLYNHYCKNKTED